MLREDEFRTLKLVVNACLESGGDPDQLVPLAIRVREADERFAAKKVEKVENNGAG